MGGGKGPGYLEQIYPNSTALVAALSPFLRPGLFKDSFNSLSYPIFFLDSFIRCQSWLFYVTDRQRKVDYLTSPRTERG